MAFAIGSGNAGKSFVWRREDALFQSPLSWYREKRRWDLSPGYEQDPVPDFYRPIVAECLTCHANSASAALGTQNRYLTTAVPEAIGCARCHGDGSRHAAKPVRDNIVNPVRLTAEKRNSVCESCHLGGEARIPNPGRTFADFTPGMALEEVFSVFVAGNAERRVTGHVEQTAASRCAADAKLWCGSCHDPHRTPAAAERAAYYRSRCVQCHSAPEHERARGGDCAGCHMPRSQSYDGGHTAFTNHAIRLSSTAAAPSAAGLRPWRPSQHATRGLALAHLNIGEKSQSLPDLQQAARQLNALLAGTPDGAVLTAAGKLALSQGKTGQAVQWLQQALQEAPRSSLAHANLAAALLAAGDRAAAVKHARKALEIEPLLETPYAILGQAEPHRAAFWAAAYRKRLGR